MEGTSAFWRGSGRLPEGIIYPDLVHSGMVETLVQNTDAFNAASRNAIRLVTARKMGDFAQESFFKNVSNLVNRRSVNDSPDNPAVTSSNVPVDEMISVKLNRRIGPIDQTFDSFRKLGENADLEVLSMLLGEQIAKATQVDQLETGLESAVAALSNQALVFTDYGNSPQSTITTDILVQALAKFGDASNRIIMWVMHSKTFFDLVRDQISANIDGISNFNVASATPVTLNRPVLVTDSAALQVGASPEPTEYITLGLTENSVVLEDSEEEFMYADVITGKENIVARLQGEFAYNASIKGFKWDVANGGINPTNAALGTGTNWDAVMDSHKDFGGIALQTL
jgi:hypothetical protein